MDLVRAYDPEIANEYGVIPAILLTNIVFWVARNEWNKRNFHNGTYWTYNSMNAYSEQFIEFSPNQIRTAMKKLADEGLIATGNFNESKYDRTLWYSLTDKGKKVVDYQKYVHGASDNKQKSIYNNGKVHLGFNTNGTDPKPKPIPDNYQINNITDEYQMSSNNPSLTPPTGENKKDLTDSGFEDFWTAYPRKKSKEDARKAWAKLKPDEQLQAVILQAVSKQKRSDQWQNPQYIPYPAHWLRAHGWEDEPDAQAAAPTQERQNENLFAELLKEMQQT